MSELEQRTVRIADCNNEVEVAAQRLGSAARHSISAYLGENSKQRVKTPISFIGQCPVDRNRPRDLVRFASTVTVSDLASSFTPQTSENEIQHSLMTRTDLIFNCELANTQDCPLFTRVEE